MTLKDIENKLKGIGIYGFRDFESQVCKAPIHLKIVFEIDFEYELFGDNCNEFWEFYRKYCYNGNIDLLLFEIPRTEKLLFEYEDTTLEVYNYECIEYTRFYQFLIQGIHSFLDEIWEEI